jgi:hypothetical protein
VVDALIGSTSKICQAGATIQQYGLAQTATCGNTDKKNTN